MDLRNMSDKVLQNVLDQALSAGETDLAVMVKNELLRRDHSAHEETDPIHPMPGAAVVLPHPEKPRLWSPRQIKAQPVAPHKTSELLAAITAAKTDPLAEKYQLLFDAIAAQLRWYADTRAAGEVGY